MGAHTTNVFLSIVGNFNLGPVHTELLAIALAMKKNWLNTHS